MGANFSNAIINIPLSSSFSFLNRIGNEKRWVTWTDDAGGGEDDDDDEGHLFPPIQVPHQSTFEIIAYPAF